MRHSRDSVSTGYALLALCGYRANTVDLSHIEWPLLDAMADQHRLRPFLYWRHSKGEIAAPPDITRLWHDAYRDNAMCILAQRRALLSAVAALGSNGIGAVALKGSALAWTVWPEPALREMRDIDVLVAQDDAPRAYGILLAAGWSGPALDNVQAARFAAHETHFPPLTSPDGVICELHARAWHGGALPGMEMPCANSAHLLAHARHEERLGTAVPGTQDMLVHLVVHAACSHLFNVGPGALVDIDLWCARKAVDWPGFWARAEREGFARAAALVFGLVERWRCEGFSARAQVPVQVDGAVLDQAELLLVQDLDRRKDISALASLSHARPQVRLAQHPLDRAEAPVSAPRRAVQLGRRTLSIFSSLMRREARRDARASAAVRKWLDG